jgi:Predicted metal-dependent phosphoesterases (PHP family)
MRTTILLWLALALTLPTNAQVKKVKIPDIPGYVTLKGDFHIHTVFSDGNVWPTVRIDEAVAEGVDVIAITDHIEYRPHLSDIPSDHNRSYDIAKPEADKNISFW